MTRKMLCLFCLLFVLSYGNAEELPAIKYREGNLTVSNLKLEPGLIAYTALDQLAKKIYTNVNSIVCGSNTIIIASDKVANPMDLALYHSTLELLNRLESRLGNLYDKAESKIEYGSPSSKSKGASFDDWAIGKVAGINPYLQIASLFKGDGAISGIEVTPDSEALMAMVAQYFTDSKNGYAVYLPHIFPSSKSLLAEKLEAVFFDVDSNFCKAKNLIIRVTSQDSKELDKVKENLKTASRKNATALQIELERIEKRSEHNNEVLKSVSQIVASLENLKKSIESEDAKNLWAIDAFLSQANNERTTFLIVKCLLMGGSNHTWQPFLGRQKISHSGGAVAQYYLFDKNGQLIQSKVIQGYYSPKSLGRSKSTCLDE